MNLANIHDEMLTVVHLDFIREFSIGDRVRVMLERVDANERKLQFSLVEEEPRPRRGGGRKGGKRRRLKES